jgi:hypothetical protein
LSALRGKKQISVKYDALPSFLVTFRCFEPVLSKSNELLLIKLAQSGNQDAGWGLLARFHRKISKIAAVHVPKGSTRNGRNENGTLKVYTAGLYDDLLSTGFLAAWEAVLAFKVDSGLRFWTFAHKQVVGAISDAAKEYMKGGVAGETRADRWLFHHHNAKPEELLKASNKFGLRGRFKSFQEAAVYIESFRRRYQFQKDGDFPREFIAAGDVKRLYDFFSPYQLAPHLRLHEPLSLLVDDLTGGKITLSEARDIICRTKKRRNLSGSTRRKQSQRRLRKSHGNNCAANLMSAGRLL